MKLTVLQCSNPMCKTVVLNTGTFAQNACPFCHAGNFAILGETRLPLMIEGNELSDGQIAQLIG